MAVPRITVDGSMAYGAPVITTSGGIAFQLNNINVERPETKAMDRDGSGRPQRQRWTADIAAITGEGQLATSSTALPIFGQTFSLTVDPAYGSELWCVMPQNYVATNGEGDIRVVPIRAEKVINGSVTTVA